MVAWEINDLGDLLFYLTIAGGLIVFFLLIFRISIPKSWNCPKCERNGNAGRFCGGCGFEQNETERMSLGQRILEILKNLT